MHYDYNGWMHTHEPNMTTLTVRNVDPTLKERLRVRAAHNGRSMESELRHILSAVLAEDQAQEINLAEAIRRRFAPLGGVELEPHPRQPVGEPPSFE
jgi:plasmid stability protein